MSSEKKVVELNANKRDVPSASDQLPLPLSRLKEAFTRKLSELCNDVYHNADDILFQRADTAKNGDEQVAYFNAMRVLRLSRKSMEIAFSQNVYDAFTNMTVKQRPVVTAAPVDIEKLTLMDHDILEHNVAVETMLGRALELYTTQLGHLVLRFQCLLPHSSITMTDLPVGPQLLINAFSAAMSDLDLDIRPKLVFLKLFDKFVICRMGPLYEATNNALIKQGVMPDLKSSDAHAYKKPARAEEIYHAETVDAAEPESLENNGEQMQVLRQALRRSGLHAELTGEAWARETRTGEPRQATAVGSAIDVSSIIDVLSKVQFSQAFGTAAPGTNLNGVASGLRRGRIAAGTPDFGDDCNIGVTSGVNDENVKENFLLDFSSLFKDLMEANKGATYSRASADVISLVSMLFEYVLEDTQIPEKMRALISRLQIPLLKTALMDKSFFDAGGHPARQLLNEISRSTIGWEERQKSGRDHLYEKIEEAIQKVLVEFDSNIAIFAVVLSDFRAFIDVDRRRAELVAKRIQDAEEGKAKGEEGQRYVQALIDQALCGKTLPKSLMPLVADAWQRVMLIAYLKEGESHPQWSQFKEVLTELIWSIDPDASGPAARKRLLRNMPRMLCAVREGLAGVSYDAVKTKYLLAELERAHEITLQKVSALPIMRATEIVKPANPIKREPAPVVAPSADSNSNPEAETEAEVEVEIDIVAPIRVEDIRPITDEQALVTAKDLSSPELGGAVQALINEVYGAPLQNDVGTAAISSESVSHSVSADVEINRAETGSADNGLMGTALEETPRISVAMAKADIANYHVGAWFEFYEKDGSKYRCKLAALIKSIGKYVFINRSGVKILEAMDSNLVQIVQAGRLTMLDDGQIFDRALESIIGGMRG